jgi:predicted amidohydrolase
MGSFVEKDASGFYNTSLMFDPEGKTIARYRKMHLFGYQSDEQQLLTPGKSVVTTKTDFGTVGLSTCYDLRFPELFRKMVDSGASIFLITSAWPKVRLEAWKVFCRARALENLSFLIACNCSGFNEGNQYAGHSMIVSPQGEVLASAGEEGVILSQEIDTKESEIFRSSFPALSDRVL